MACSSYPHLLLRIPDKLSSSFEEILKNDEEGTKTISFKVIPERTDCPDYYTLEINEDEYPALVRTIL